jgi:hypothetical protein
MRTPYCLVAGLALVAACGPSFGAGSDTGGSGLPLRAALGEVGAPGTPAMLTLPAAQPQAGARRPPAAAWTGEWLLAADTMPIVHTCGLQTLSLPDLARPAARPFDYPSLGGPTPALTPSEDLPGLREVTPQDGRDDTLRVIRSHW